MKWNELMQGQVNLLSPTDAKAFCHDHATNEYQLIDVRQPGEYASGHIPGAKLIPLDQLIAGQGEYDKTKPTLVYCHAGRRSAAACQWMSENGFEKLMDIQGGYSAWNGLAAQGPVEHQLNLIDSTADFPDALTMAYAMEDGLQIFYQKLADQMSDAGHKELLTRLASFEDHHKDNLKTKGEGNADFSERPEQYANVMEGGYDIDQVVTQVAPRLTNNIEIFSLAMAIEAQAYDFYIRLSHQATNAEAKNLFVEMANEEKGHLGLLAKEFDQMLAAR